MESTKIGKTKEIVEVSESDEATEYQNGQIKENDRRAEVDYDSDDEPILKLFQSNGHTETDEPITPSTDFIKEEEEVEDEENQNEKERREKEKKDFEGLMEKQKLSRLRFLLEKTTLYSSFLSEKVSLPDSVAIDKPVESPAEKSSASSSNGKSNGRSKKRKLEKSEEVVEDENPTKKGKGETTFKQPKLVTGGTMRSYQLQGVEWMISLYENGLNGILADEMGLGKTLQCIALFAHLIGKNVCGPFLVAAPLSTLGNWVREVQRFCPTVSAIMYHGTKEEREQIRINKLNPKKLKNYPIVITSYDIIMRDRKYLQKFNWKYIVVDEGHRIKNLNCKLIRELKSYHSANRLLLTGTPLQNKLSELWSMLNFLLPDIFDDLDSFQQWFDFSEIGQKDGHTKVIAQEEEHGIVTKLHEILRPFLLRRMKTDVELQLPSKKEKIIHTTLTSLQSKYYMAILAKNLQSLLSPEAIKVLRNRGTSSEMNMLMQLRKCCNHPYLFEWPTNSKGEEKVDENLIKVSGKLQMMDRLLPRLKKEGHRVLIFSQMTRVLDIVEDYLNLRNYTFSRIDGTTPQIEREEQIQEFNLPQSKKFIFLLSTRAGGLGVNLTGADTVIFYDNDWNPQMDLQAQDRCHRIGQTKPVRVYRLATANSIESRILERQESKMKLERLVIQKGNFVGVKAKSSLSAEILEELLNTETPSLVGHTEEINDEFLFNFGD